MVKMMIKGRKCVVNQPIYVLDTVSYWEFRREYRVRHPDGLELRLKLPGMPDDRYNDLHLQRELRVEESKNERLRIPLEGFWGRSTMVPVSAAKRDGPVTRVDHIIQIRWNKDKRRWDVRFLRHDEMSTMKFSPAMTAYEVDDELEKAPVGGWKRKQAALAEPPAENEPRKRPRLG
ncbi:hypothetical protein AX14_002565 [Amanita brunnescens Koide BX004]|nr:hypothetical protein AX14_002565 [Amanita brunnescens Koide BX004]